MKKQFGFTLIELMVVMAIVAILATAGISTYAGYIKKSIDVKTLAYVTAWNSAIIQLKADSSNGAIPTADAINTYLALHPVSSRTHIASLVEAFSNIGKAFGATITSAISKYPAGGRTDCVQSSGTLIPCHMITVFLSNGEFFTTYGVLSLSNLINYHSVTGIVGLSGGAIYGSTRGNSGIISSSTVVISDITITAYKSGLTATTAYTTL